MSLPRRSRLCLNDGWRFRFEGERGDATPVSLPHSWNALDTMECHPEQHYRRAVGIYECSLPPQVLTVGERLWIEFEAASQKASVELNGRPIGEHLGGYTAFALDVSGPVEAREILVQVDNRPDRDLVPSDLSDFFLYGGLTRNVWLYKTGAIRIAASWIDAEVTSDVATLTARGRVEGLG
ncbi:MAG TPA: hypothetical protein VK821_04265, partial [Dehalococcoidia bacterium]|nr:hypothetical protein [Dehalococcoidia bacterium]